MNVRSSFLPFALPDTDENEINQIVAAVRSGWITTGPKVRQFETEFAAAVGARHAIAVNSCTAAMHLALEAVGLQSGDLVITTPYTFAATAEVIRYFNAIPIFIDIRPDTLNINTALLTEAIESLVKNEYPQAKAHWLPPLLRNSLYSTNGNRLKALLPVHFAGLPADLDPICSLAAEHNLALIEDAAHAFPASYNGHHIGAAAPSPTNNNKTCSQQSPSNTLPLSAACFSFYATKTITTGEGGMITTNDDELAERCRIMALHGISKDAWKRYSAEGAWYYEIVAPGYKYNMTDIAAAMGLAQLAKAEWMRKRRWEIAMQYNQAFEDIAELQIPTDRTNREHAWHIYALRLNLDRLTINRGQFIKELKSRNIGTSVHFIPLHLHPYYQDTYGYRPEDFPVSYREYQREISLPIYSKMSDQDVQDVITAVLDIVGSHRVARCYALQAIAP